MDSEMAWTIRRDCFRKFFAGLSFEQMLQIADDVKVGLDYRANLMDRLLDHDEFSEFMKSQWGEK